MFKIVTYDRTSARILDVTRAPMDLAWARRCANVDNRWYRFGPVDRVAIVQPI